MMSNTKSGSLTSKDGCIISLTLGDLKDQDYTRMLVEQWNFSGLKDTPTH